MPRHYARLHNASSAALLGAAVILVGCEEGAEDVSAVDGQMQMNETDLDEADPNELPIGMGEDDGEMGESRLNDSTPEQPGVNEYDSAPLAPGE
ncbi:hypothetical protein [Alienimonas californiensis]|uniref:Uncharacterized protein n=1 Tax=Alienimonas californiensis TaxID=2527989 RepID=A0A517P5D6_9PLAN|nr:hypothetical protein [Alienimonas californiensis]QDT14581.1 hypothetical protein CA12_06560 [Alienimonas californiensis]